MLILIDPVGYKNIKWNQIVKIYQEAGIDVIFNFDTTTIGRNAAQKNEKYEKALTEFFGDEEWKKIRNESQIEKNLLEYYVKKIKEITGKNVIELEVNKHGNNTLYHMLIVTKSSGGKNVIDYTKDVMSGDTTRIIKRELEATLTKQSRLFDS